LEQMKKIVSDAEAKESDSSSKVAG
jgi:hypothetical protein